MVVVQVVVVSWTKASRGHPGAGQRAAVPEGFELPRPDDPDAAAHLQVVTADEADGFTVVRGDLRPATLPLRERNVTIEATGERYVRVVRRRESGLGWPARARDAAPIVLAPGQRCSIVRNHRFSGYSGWSYRKTVVNVAHLDRFDIGTFTTSPVDHRLDEQASLF